MKNKFNDLSLAELKEKLKEFRLKYHRIRMDFVLGHVENPMERRNVRRGIARLKTAVAEFESGRRGDS